MAHRGMPYGEARRLRYIVLICKELLVSGSVDIDFLAEKLLQRAKEIYPKLEQYMRKTGVMRTRAVAQNYISFCHWLDFLQRDGRLIVPNGLTAFIANMDLWEDFSLTDREKIGLFLRIIEKKEIHDLIGSLKVKNRIKDYTPYLSEHFVESFFEWFVDLGILRPYSKTLGRFNLTHNGYLLKEALIELKSIPEASRTFSSCVLGKAVNIRFDIPDSKFRELLDLSLRRLCQHIRSELDPNLYSVLPILLDLQLEIIVRLNQLSSLGTLIQKLEDLSRTSDMIFSWDPLTQRGYLKVL